LDFEFGISEVCRSEPLKEFSRELKEVGIIFSGNTKDGNNKETQNERKIVRF